MIHTDDTYAIEKKIEDFEGKRIKYYHIYKLKRGYRTIDWEVSSLWARCIMYDRSWNFCKKIDKNKYEPDCGDFEIVRGKTNKMEVSACAN